MTNYVLLPLILLSYITELERTIQLKNGIVSLLISDKRVATRRGIGRRRASSNSSEGGPHGREEQAESEGGNPESDEDSSALSDTSSDSSGSERASESQQRNKGSADNPIRVRLLHASRSVHSYYVLVSR